MSLKPLINKYYRKMVNRNMYQDFSFHHPRPCYQCIHYRSDSLDTLYWLHNMNWITHENVTGRCHIFDNKEVAICRQFKDLCGKEGRYFDKGKGGDFSGSSMNSGYVSFN